MTVTVHILQFKAFCLPCRCFFLFLSKLSQDQLESFPNIIFGKLNTKIFTYLSCRKNKIACARYSSEVT